MRLFIICSCISFSAFCQIDTTSSICEYPGGIFKMREKLKEHLFYPQSAQKDKLVGKCIIKFTIDTIGNPINIQVQKSLRGDCDTAAMLAVRYLIGWKPSQIHGKKVIANMSLPVSFSPSVK